MDNEELDKLSHVVGSGELTRYDNLYRLIIIGDSGVGKSCIRIRALHNKFRDEHDITIGVEFGSFSIKVEETLIKIQIWDTAGQETFKSVTKIFFKGAHCIFLVYDITKPETFYSIHSWLHEIKDNAAEDILIVLVGNMLDLEAQRAVTKQQALDFVTKHNLDEFIETSAKSGDNVKKLFIRTAKMLYLQCKKEKLKKQPEAAHLKVNSNKTSGKNKCC